MVGTIVSLLGTAASAVGSKIANDKYKQSLDQDNANNQNFYSRLIAQDPTQRSDNAAYLRLLSNRLDAANKVAQNKGKIMGETPEVALARQENNSKAYADAISRMQAMTDQRRDMLLGKKQAATEAYQGLERKRQQDLMQNWSNLADNSAKLGASSIEGTGIGDSATKTATAGNAGRDHSFGIANPDVNKELFA